MVNESRAQLKERLRAQGNWGPYLQLRDKLKAEGMPPAKAREEAAAWFPPDGEAKPDPDESALLVSDPQNVITFLDTVADCPDEAAELDLSNECLWNENTTDGEILTWVWLGVESIKQEVMAYRAQRPAVLGEEDLTDEQLINHAFISFENLNRVQQLFAEERESTLAAVGD